MSDLYHYVRFRWWTEVDLNKIMKELAERFNVKMIGSKEKNILKDDKQELMVNADTLTATLSSFRVVLSQKKKLSFTKKDMELRKRMLELYPQNRPTPFPWQFTTEPKFQIEE